MRWTEMPMKVTGALVVLLAVLAPGCASAPKVHFYTLDMRASGTSSAPVNIRIERMRESDALARRDLMINKTATEIEYYTNARWATAVNEMLATKFQEEFGQKQPGRATVLLWGTVVCCGQEDTPSGPQAHLKVQVSARADGKSRYEAPLFEKTYDVTQRAAAGTPSAVVAALSECASQMASEIKRDAAQAGQNIPAGEEGSKR